MLVLKYLLVMLGIGLFGSSSAVVVYDIYLSSQLRRLLGRQPDGQVFPGTVFLGTEAKTWPQRESAAGFARPAAALKH